MDIQTEEQRFAAGYAAGQKAVANGYPPDGDDPARASEAYYTIPILREGLRLLAEHSTPRSGETYARGEPTSASVATPIRRARRTANSSNGRKAASPRRAGMEPVKRGAG